MSKRKSDSEHGSVAKKISVGHWKDGLKRAMEDPNLVVKSDELTVTIRDKFPKAQYHFLIIPKSDVPEIHSLTSNHIKLLEHMEREAMLIIESNCKGMSPEQFNVGYHAIPSMRPFHLHVISKDFDSPCLKTKKHWNSFTTDFFRKSSDVLTELKKEGKVKIEKEKYEILLKSSLSCLSKNTTNKSRTGVNKKAKKRHEKVNRCYWCKTTQQNIPTLKSHVKRCSQNKLTIGEKK